MMIYDVLKKDHDELKQLLQQLVEMKPEKAEARHTLIEKIRDEVVPHSRAEEAVFYNSLRSLEMTRDLAMHGYQEHLEAESLLRVLQLQDKIDAKWIETAKKLKDSLEHHIKEEEGQLFNAAKQVFTNEEALMMAEAFEKLKPEVKEQGFVGTTVDMVVNMMPPRFATVFQKFSLENKI